MSACVQCNDKPAFFVADARAELCFRCAELYRQGRRKLYGIGLPSRKPYKPPSTSDLLVLTAFVILWVLAVVLAVMELSR